VVAYKNGQSFYQSGVVPSGSSPLGLANDPDLWLLRDCLFDPNGAEVNMFWQAARYDGNALPAQATFDPTDPRYYQTHVVRNFPHALGSVLSQVPDRVTLRIFLQPIGVDVLADLVKSGDLDPSVPSKMQTLQVGTQLEWTPQTATLTYQEDGFPVTCVTTTAFNIAADKVPAPEHSKCSP
jgi:hypothetical protein